MANTYLNHYVANGTNSNNYSYFKYARPMDTLEDTNGVGNDPAARLISRMVAPSQTILVSENEGSYVGGYAYRPIGGNGLDFTNHLDTTNFLFCDGHVKAMRPTATYSNNATSGVVNMWSCDLNRVDETSGSGNLRGELRNREVAMMQ